MIAPAPAAGRFVALVAGCALAALGTLPVAATGVADGSASGRTDASPELSAVDDFVSRELAAATIPGAALAITRGPDVLHVRGYGVDSTGRPVAGDTRFRIASLSKSVTALAVMQLVEAGRLDLDDTVASHLADFRLADPRGGRITVEQLLGQTSGLADGDDAPFSREQPTNLREAVTALHDARLSADPGTRWSYHNPNYQVAARLVEAVSGEPFADYLRDHVFDPAGMDRSSTTDFWDQPVDDLAEGHVLAYGAAIARPAPHVFTAGDGGVVSTADDLARWLVVQGDGGLAPTGVRLLSPQGITRMHTSNDPGGYALGWDTSGPLSAPTVVEHSGTVMTFSAQQALVPGSGLGVALLFNASSPLLGVEGSILHGVINILEGRTDSPQGRPYAQRTVDLLLAALSLASLGLGAAGVVRSRRWAVARRASSRLRTGAELTPPLVLVGVALLFPTFLGALTGHREVTWTTAAYGWPALAILVLCGLLAGLGTAAARLWHLGRRDRPFERTSP